MTFKDEMQQIWIASATSTQKGESQLQSIVGCHASLTFSCLPHFLMPPSFPRASLISSCGRASLISSCLPSVPYNTITKIEGFKIDGKEEYSIIAVSLGAGDSSKYWLYFFPTQHVASLKIRILGVESLL